MLCVKTCGIWLRVVLRKKFPALNAYFRKEYTVTNEFWQDFKHLQRYNMLIKEYNY